MSDNTDPPDGEPTQATSEALTVRDAIAAIDKPATLKTPQDMRVVEVSEALLPAYQKASTLDLTDAEVDALMAQFPDEVVEVRPHDGLLYIPHIHISDRLNRIFRPGKWALVRRREWFDSDSNTMYGEYVLMIRGCFVGESVGGHPFAKNNPKINYSDVLESTAAEALRRIAGKRLSCGSQVWNPDYCRRWEKKWRGYAGGKWFKRDSTPDNRANPAPEPLKAPEATKPPAKATAPATGQTAGQPTSAHKARVIELLSNPDGLQVALEYFAKINALLPNEGLEDLPLEFVPATKEQMDGLMRAIGEFAAGSEARLPYPKHPRQEAPAQKPPINVGRNKTPEECVKGFKAEEEPWYPVIIPIPRKGQKRDEYLQAPDTIGSLYEARHGTDEAAQEARQRLWGFVVNWEPKGWTKRDGTEMPPSDADLKCREALDQFNEWFSATHPDEKL